MLSRVLICSSLMVATAVGLETGAPAAACKSMTPNHLGIEADPISDCPFEVKQSSFIYGNASEAITVTLAAPADSSRTFRGFLIEAFNPLNEKRIGRFVATSSAVQTMDECHGATHTSRAEKKSVTLLWKPEGVKEETPLVVFRTTFVENFATFYVGVDSTINGVSAVKRIEEAMSSIDADSPDSEDE